MQVGHARQHRFQVWEIRDTVDARVPAGAGDELEVIVARQRGNVLIAGNLADAHQSNS